jgi:hypothetical protein
MSRKLSNKHSQTLQLLRQHREHRHNPRKLTAMSHAHAVVVRNTRNAAAVSNDTQQIIPADRQKAALFAIC